MRNPQSLLPLLCMLALAGCMAGVDGVSEELSLVECDRDDHCDRGQVCLGVETDGRTQGYCSTGDRCHTSRMCPPGSVCRGGDGLHCLVVERDPERPDACPRGSLPAPVRCAPGFEPSTVSRDPLCETCDPDESVAARCRAAGLSPERCRALLGGGDDPSSIAERCRAAGISPERCRALADGDDGSTAERCRRAGLTREECRELVTATDETDRYARCRAAGISAERCASLLGEDEPRAACLGDGDCRRGAYCHFAESCGIDRSTRGVCEPRPELCTREYVPVCGCDGVTYGNACSAASAGVSISHRGECTDCRTTGCRRGESCEPCWGSYACIPAGAIC